MPQFDSEPFEPAIFGRTAECPSIEDLAAFVSTPQTAESDVHVAGCAYCRNEIALLRAFESDAATPEEAAAVRWISAELARREAPWRTGTSRSLWEVVTSWIPAPAPRWLPAAALACLLVVVGSALYLGSRGPAGIPNDVTQGTWRSTAIAVVAPTGDVSAPQQFVWRGAEGASTYHVRLLEVDGTEIWSADTPAAQIAIPAQVRAQLQPGRSFRWQVSASAAAGRIAESSLQSFHIK
jgi:hypothetical protein